MQIKGSGHFADCKKEEKTKKGKYNREKKTDRIKKTDKNKQKTKTNIPENNPPK